MSADFVLFTTGVMASSNPKLLAGCAFGLAAHLGPNRQPSTPSGGRVRAHFQTGRHWSGELS